MANDLVQRVAESVQDSMDEILANFKPGARITVLVRTPGKPSADFCMTDDDLDEVIMMVHRRKGETPTTSPNLKGITLEAEARDVGVSIGIAMSVAFMLRDRDEQTMALEWWHASGITIEQCERIGVDEYDLAPIRAALTTSEGSDNGR